jgi:hypothetical protein
MKLYINHLTGSIFIASQVPGLYRMIRAGWDQWIVTDYLHDAVRTGYIEPISLEVRYETAGSQD